jgi:ribosomal protein S18 acetylase RimI-like enzyme
VPSGLSARSTSEEATPAGRTGLSVRAVRPDEWRVWRALRLAALTEAPYAFGATLVEWRDAGEDRWRQRLRSVALNLVATLEAQPAGMVSATRATDGEVELISMWVAPDGRGRGVGDALIQAVVAWAHGQPADRVVLAVRAGNRQAIGLYERNGFRPAGWASEPDDPFPERRMVLALHRR